MKIRHSNLCLVLIIAVSASACGTLRAALPGGKSGIAPTASTTSSSSKDSASTSPIKAAPIAKKTKGAGKADEKVEAFERKHGFRLSRLIEMDAGERDFAVDLKGMTAEVKNLHKIDKIVKDCEVQFAKNPPRSCQLARNYEDVYRAYLPLWIEHQLERAATQSAGTITSLEKRGVSYEVHIGQFQKGDKWIDEIGAEYKAVFGPFDLDIPQTAFAPFETQITQFNAALENAAKVSRWPESYSYEDGGIRKAVISTFKPAQLKVKRVGLVLPQWTIKKTPRGIPLYRFRNVSVMVQKRGESFCRVYAGMTANAQFTGGGRYAKPTISYTGGEQFAVSSCK